MPYADALIRLILDPDDTAVTDAAVDALVARNDDVGIALVLRAATRADDEHLDHLYAAFSPLAAHQDLSVRLRSPEAAAAAGDPELAQGLRWLTRSKSGEPGDGR